jgi:hypothetical protein
MRELRAEIQIAAPIDQVWRTLTDFDQWKVWNPMVNRASGSASIGAKLQITMRGPDSKDAMKYEPTLIEVNPPNSLRWRATMMSGFLFTNDRVFELKEEKGGTTFVNREEFSGLMVPMFWSKMTPFVVPMLEQMNMALKHKVEAQT